VKKFIYCIKVNFFEKYFRKLLKAFAFSRSHTVCGKSLLNIRIEEQQTHF